MEFWTERLHLRPWTDEDAEALYPLASDPEVGPMAGWHPHTSVENSREIIETVLSEDGTFAVVDRATGDILGSVGYFPTNAAGAGKNEMEIGYWIGKPYWGRGYGPEAAQCLVDHCFEALGCPRVWCGYFAGNEKSRRCMEKCGFTFHHAEDHLFWPVTQEYKDQVFECLERADWEARRTA